MMLDGLPLLDDDLQSVLANAKASRTPGAMPVDPGASSAKSRVDDEQARLAGRICPRMLADVSAAKSPCALLLGPTGCGKTSAAKWMLVPIRAWLDSPRPETLPAWARSSVVAVIRARDLASASKRHGLGEGFPPEILNARVAGVLCVDDVGSEGNEVTALQDVLDYRYENGKPTVVTSGLTLAELESHIGKAYLRRILDQHVQRRDGAEYPVIVSQP